MHPFIITSSEKVRIDSELKLQKIDSESEYWQNGHQHWATMFYVAGRRSYMPTPILEDQWNRLNINFAGRKNSSYEYDQLIMLTITSW